MYCMKCQKSVYECDCPDIDERLAAIGATGRVIFNPAGMENRDIKRAKKNLNKGSETTEQSNKGEI